MFPVNTTSGLPENRTAISKTESTQITGEADTEDPYLSLRVAKKTQQLLQHMKDQIRRGQNIPKEYKHYPDKTDDRAGPVKKLQKHWKNLVQNVQRRSLPQPYPNFAADINTPHQRIATPQQAVGKKGQAVPKESASDDDSTAMPTRSRRATFRRGTYEPRQRHNGTIVFMIASPQKWPRKTIKSTMFPVKTTSGLPAIRTVIPRTEVQLPHPTTSSTESTDYAAPVPAEIRKLLKPMDTDSP
uniref:Reverse transcriptase domain-containing protein n=1 Tax=Panagrellus redivivus TaxID=6233 RepID=A0A7E4V6F5_PANRE